MIEEEITVQNIKEMKNTLFNPHSKLVAARRTQHIAMTVFRIALFIGLSYVILYQLLYMVSNAFRSDADILDSSVIWVPKHYVLTNIKQAFVSLDYSNSLWYTFYYNIVAAFLQVAITAFVGYGFARFEFKGRGILFAVALFTIIVPAQTTIIPMFINFSNFDVLWIMKLYRLITGSDTVISILNTPAAFWLPAMFGMGIRSGLFIYIFRQFFRNMPKELEEAAMIDGCGPYYTFFHIMLPNAGTILLTGSIFSMVWYYNDYYLNTMFADKHPMLTVSLSHLSMAIGEFVSLSDQQLIKIRVQAGCLLVILPPLILYFIVQRKFTQGIERSGIVG